ncbi:probable G-protein coupled receptor 152 [Mustela erminea]|uniref:probable G-protein coupled receptor 152 n=1 Tax=Mustela erminea TaxID=36723 RepID=UPI001386754B|nr:probable G-protein coupled receptor 152 [Mustela erminea]
MPAALAPPGAMQQALLAWGPADGWTPGQAGTPQTAPHRLGGVVYLKAPAKANHPKGSDNGSEKDSDVPGDTQHPLSHTQSLMIPLIHQAPALWTAHGGPQTDTAMEADPGAAGLRPRTEPDDEDYYPQGVWDTVFLVALLLLGLPANGLMAWLAGSQARQGAGRRLALLLLSLALSDFLFLAAAAFQILEIQRGGHWPLGTAACRFYYFLWGVSYSSGLFLLAALSVDRCLLALCPRWYPGHRPARLPLWVCAGVWVLATLFSVPWLVFPEAADWWYDLVICLDFWDSEELPLRMLEILGGFLPFLLLLVCHVLTQAATACKTCCRRPRPAASRGFARVAQTILSTYVVLRLPYHLAQLLYLAFLWDVYPGYLLWEALVYSDYLTLLNSCLSPFLCLLASADLRALLRAVLSSFAAALCEEWPSSFTPAEPQTQVDSGGHTSPGPMAQPQLDSVAAPQADPTAQLQLDSVAPPQLDSVAAPRADPTVQPQLDSVAPPQLDSVAAPQADPTAQPQLDSVAAPWADPTAQPQLDSVAAPQVDPTAQTQLDSVAPPQLDSVAPPQVDPTTQPQLEPVAPQQADPTAQPQLETAAPPTGRLLCPATVGACGSPTVRFCGPASAELLSSAPDPTPEAPENPAVPAACEGESPSSVPLEETGPTFCRIRQVQGLSQKVWEALS